ncbi:MAG: ATP-binding protein [Kiritimatiellae bacterium]|nr:ATP-binding protein [Kiritimatiellia bacterium]
MKKLPIGTQDFETLRRDDCLYVDKTAFIHRLITDGRVYFLSRPRRFGKSLLVTTLKAIFEGRRDLFEGLAIAGLDYEWAPHPVLHLDFSGRGFSNGEDLREWLGAETDVFCRTHAVESDRRAPEDRLRAALSQLAAAGRRTAVLIDEYDKPILDHIEDPARAGEMRETLKGFYAALKANDAHLRFVFLTGVSKFAKMSVFSGLNNLKDITLDARFATMLGYTQEELEACFPDGIDALARAQGLAREACVRKTGEWYNGYRFAPDAQRVYNPFSTLLLFDALTFREYWFETGTPTFLLKLLRRHEKPAVGELDGVRVGEGAFSSYEPERLQPLPLLFQTGYLTILDYSAEDELYTLGYPNREVRRAFSTALLEEFAGTPNGLNAAYTVDLRDALAAGDMEKFFETMRVFFANVPYDIQLKQEKYYQTIFYLVFTLLGMRIETEVRTERGRIDAAAQTADTVYVFEFKLSGTAADALDQARANEYTLKYQGQGKRVRVFGVAFDPETRNIGEWIEEAD